ncbi:hypothetical protein LD125_00558 [Mesoplasma sp. JKS002658]|nr:hypothetical protein [Mesoplasma sp. JKS002664]MCL8212177.1 hypothetical protein [Mesoplasma sp. JKS002662]MCL8213319.1 hypothetical protein [Mesoplasma sp. JKS002660]MCL8214294.1 hypothetical protein [Mesoplasma sp. JKS002658]MCL8214662.1 hypothetical protein [Mesoplasma sp. JKS002663]MCL8215614.1 hypothetical protein [Mesoplasma sp. JKS002659]
MDSTAIGIIIACGKLSQDEVGHQPPKVPLTSSRIKIIKKEAFDLSNYIDLDPGYKRVSILPLDPHQFVYSLVHDQKNNATAQYWTDPKTGAEYSLINGQWGFSTISATTSFSITLMVSVTGYESSYLTINYLAHPDEEVLVNVELRDYVIPQTMIDQWYADLGSDTDTLLVHAWAKIGDQTVVFGPNYGAEPGTDLIATWFQEDEQLRFSLDQIENVTIHFEVLDQKPGQKRQKIITFTQVVSNLDIATIE